MTEGDSAIEIGRLASAKKLIEIQKLEDAYIARLVSVGSAILEKSWTESFTVESLDGKVAQDRLIRKIVADLSGKAVEQIEDLISNNELEVTQSESATISNGFLNADGSYTLVNPRVFYAGKFTPINTDSSNLSGVCRLFGFSSYAFHEYDSSSKLGVNILSDGTSTYDYYGKITKITCKIR